MGGFLLNSLVLRSAGSLAGGVFIDDAPRREKYAIRITNNAYSYVDSTSGMGLPLEYHGMGEWYPKKHVHWCVERSTVGRT